MRRHHKFAAALAIILQVLADIDQLTPLLHGLI